MLKLPPADHTQLRNPAHPLVVAQALFGAPASEVTADTLASFQSTARELGLELPIVKAIQGANVVVGPGMATTTNTLTGYQVASQDGRWSVALTSTWVTLETPAFTNFADDFGPNLTSVLTAATKSIKPVTINRAGLRFINVLTRPEGDNWSGWIREALIALSQDDLLTEGLIGHAQQLLFETAPQIKSTVRCGPTTDGTDEPKFMLDIDTYSEPDAVWRVDAIADVFDSLNEAGVSLFQTLITQKMLTHLQGEGSESRG